MDGTDNQPALIVIGLQEQAVIVYDPLSGERVLPSEIFQMAWRLQRNLAILVRR